MQILQKLSAFFAQLFIPGIQGGSWGPPPKLCTRASKHLATPLYICMYVYIHMYTYMYTYKTLTNQQPTYLYNSLSFPSHSVSTRSSDSLVLSIPRVRSSLGKRAFSVIGPTTLEFTTSRYPKFEFFTNFPFQAQNTPLQNCIPSLGSFPSPWTVYPDSDSCYSHFMSYRMTPSVRHRAIEVHYYYYY